MPLDFGYSGVVVRVKQAEALAYLLDGLQRRKAESKMEVCLRVKNVSSVTNLGTLSRRKKVI